MTEEAKPSNDSGKIEKRDEKGRLLPGSVLNPQGKKAGTLNFSTKWIKFIEKVAEQNETTPATTTINTIYTPGLFWVSARSHFL